MLWVLLYLSCSVLFSTVTSGTSNSQAHSDPSDLYNLKFLKTAMKKISLRSTGEVRKSLNVVTKKEPFLLQVLSKPLREVVDEGNKRSNKTILADLVKFDLWHTTKAILDVAALLKRHRLFMKTYLVGKKIMKMSGVNATHYTDDIENDLKVVDIAINEMNGILKSNRSFETIAGILEELNTLVDPTMSCIVAHELKTIAKAYRPMYEEHLELAFRLKEPIFETFAIYARIFMNYF
ncbi:unnamed protein product [Cylicocyclus nassatus]|uniref:Uncharacterized protein n=1 Tax=Cylicocyclus nassatus TaxID=53992 RepID=A0AA36DLA2_CYLNA|nr:unnamed protein product [Cylicocyclus nassatus]